MVLQLNILEFPSTKDAFCQGLKELGPGTAKLALLLIKMMKHEIVKFFLHK